MLLSRSLDGAASYLLKSPIMPVVVNPRRKEILTPKTPKTHGVSVAGRIGESEGKTEKEQLSLLKVFFGFRFHTGVRRSAPKGLPLNCCHRFNPTHTSRQRSAQRCGLHARSEGEFRRTPSAHARSDSPSCTQARSPCAGGNPKWPARHARARTVRGAANHLDRPATNL